MVHSGRRDRTGSGICDTVTAIADRCGTGRSSYLDLPEPRQWDRLTARAGRDLLYGSDLFFREAWASLCVSLGEEEAYRFARDHALLWLRPDAFAAGVADVVARRVTDAGFLAVAARPVRMDRAGVRGLYQHELARATAERLLLLDAVVSLAAGLVVLLHLPGGDPSASERLTALKGPNVPSDAAAGTLRSLAGSPNRLLTMVHTSSDPADLVRELGVFFDWEALRGVLAEGSRRGAERDAVDLEAQVRHVVATVASGGSGSDGDRSVLTADAPAAPDRWPAIRELSDRVPLVAHQPAPLSRTTCGPTVTTDWRR